MESSAKKSGATRDASAGRPLRVEIIGRADDSTAFAMVNRHWCTHLSQGCDLDIRSVQHQEDLSGEADCVIWHSYEDDFAALRAPKVGKFIVVRTWDFGPFPPSWARKITRECDRLWVHTHWIRQQATAAGVPERMIGVIPHGVAPAIFCPEGPAYPLPADKLFTFSLSARRFGVRVSTSLCVRSSLSFRLKNVRVSSSRTVPRTHSTKGSIMQRKSTATGPTLPAVVLCTFESIFLRPPWRRYTAAAISPCTPTAQKDSV